MAYANRAPKVLTVLVALVFVALGVLGTFLEFGGDRMQGIAEWCYVVATVILLLGIFLKRI